MRRYQSPEMSRVPLEELVLQIHLLGRGPAAAFLAGVLEPPAPRAVAAAVTSLAEVGALEVAAGGPPGGSSGSSSGSRSGGGGGGAAWPPSSSERLTALGHHLAGLPVDPRLGKLMVLGACLGCLGPAVSLAVALSYKSPFSAPFDKQVRREQWAVVTAQ